MNVKVAVLGCDAVLSDKWVPTFRRNLDVSIMRVNMWTAASFEMLLPTYQIARRQSKYTVTLAVMFSMVLTQELSI